MFVPLPSKYHCWSFSKRILIHQWTIFLKWPFLHARRAMGKDIGWVWFSLLFLSVFDASRSLPPLIVSLWNQLTNFWWWTRIINYVLFSGFSLFLIKFYCFRQSRLLRFCDSFLLFHSQFGLRISCCVFCKDCPFSFFLFVPLLLATDLKTVGGKCTLRRFSPISTVEGRKKEKSFLIPSIVGEGSRAETFFLAWVIFAVFSVLSPFLSFFFLPLTCGKVRRVTPGGLLLISLPPFLCPFCVFFEIEEKPTSQFYVIDYSRVFLSCQLSLLVSKYHVLLFSMFPTGIGCLCSSILNTFRHRICPSNPLQIEVRQISRLDMMITRAWDLTVSPVDRVCSWTVARFQYPLRVCDHPCMIITFYELSRVSLTVSPSILFLLPFFQFRTPLMFLGQTCSFWYPVIRYLLHRKVFSPCLLPKYP